MRVSSNQQNTNFKAIPLAQWRCKTLNNKIKNITIASFEAKDINFVKKFIENTPNICKNDFSKLEMVDITIRTIRDILQNHKDKRFEKVKTYIYRHGKKGDVVRFLDYELSDAKHILKTLYRTLDDNSGGMAGYFTRPIHRMDNKTLVKLYGVIDNRLRASKDAGFITEDECNSTAQWALVRIYEIQNNSKLIRAYKLYKDIRPESL
jgi:hypothetical protein